jgi:hypothetical protein
MAQTLEEVLNSRAAAKVRREPPDWAILAIFLAVSAYMLIVPVARSFYHVEVDYNEGWNAYNAQAAAHHAQLYGSKYSWTTVNYPIVSFYLIGFLSRLHGGDPVFIGRLISLVSLLISCVLVALIVKRLTRRWGPSVFAGAFCLTLFCTAASPYVGMDDPQMLAHPFFLLGLWLYLADDGSSLLLAAVAGLFVLGGNIKHNLLPLPIAVFIDLLCICRSKAVRFIVFGAILLGASIAISIWVGGPFFIAKLLTPRSYSLRKAFHFMGTYGDLQIPLVASLIWSIAQFRSRKFRIVSLYFMLSLLLGIALGGGTGVNVNTYFDNFLAMSIIMGVCLDFVWQTALPFLHVPNTWRFAPPLVIFSAVIFAFSQSPIVALPKYFSLLPPREKQFEAEVSFLAAQPGPAICESLLRCYYAGKPFVFDPFNATSLVRFKKLNGQELVQRIAEKRFGAIQIDSPASEVDRPSERFSNEILDGIDRYYQISRRDPGCVIYVPRPAGTTSGQDQPQRSGYQRRST